MASITCTAWAGRVSASFSSAFVLALFAALALNTRQVSSAQQPAPQETPSQQSAAPDANAQAVQAPAPAASETPAAQPAQSDASAAAPQQNQPQENAAASTASPAAPKSENAQGGAITEEELRHLLVGKSLYLRGGYLDSSLEFDEHGHLSSHSTTGSYTLCGIEIDKVRLSKHKVELDGARYGLHFLGALPYEDPTKAVDRVKITPKKKYVKITIDREQVVTPKKKKEKDHEKNAKNGPGGLVAPPESDAEQPAEPAAQADNAAAQPAGADQAKAEPAAEPDNEQAAAPQAVTTTTSPAHAAKTLKDALDNIFADGLDERMMAAMPDFWKLYYEAAAAKTDFHPADPSVQRQAVVDQKAKLLTTFQPESNDYAQDAGVAGMSLYHAVIGADGRPGQIAVARPIGFGLDESAVAAIRKATFAPAMKDGKPVPVMLDLVVEFRIYSKRTNVPGNPADSSKPASAILPGPYSVTRTQISQNQSQ
jgi:hypothetical protein